MPRTLCRGLLALWPTLGLLAQVVTTPISSTNPTDGPAMYKSYCASCHGADAKGRGPAAAALKVPATDLTKLARNNDGEFPFLHVTAALSQPGGAHGTGEMPVWTDVFRLSGQDSLIVSARIYNLARYLETLQDPPAVAKPREAKTAPPPTVTSISPVSGGAMFRAYCASCHGPDARGAGPAAWTLNTTPPDLTLLKRQHNGKFPEDRVAAILRHGTADTIHGSSEMPVWGNVFRDSGESTATRQMRTHNLVRYIESLQRQ